MRKKIITRWELPDGRRCKAHTPGAHKVRVESRRYYAFNVPGHPKPVPLASTKSVAQTLFARLVAGGEAALAGLPDAAERGKGVPALIEEFRARQEARGAAPKTVREQYRFLCRFAEEIRWAAPARLTAAAVADWLSRLRAGGAGPQTHNIYLTRIRAFARWLAAAPRKLLPRDLLDDLPLLNVEVDVRRARRSLSVEEMGRVLAVALESPRRIRRLDGPARHDLYSAACATGFRAQELASLTPSHLHLDAAPPHVVLPARRGKDRRPTRQPIPPDVVPLLRARAQGLEPHDRLWPGSWWHAAAELLQADLEAAGIPYAVETPDGPLYADFHALRHTYVSLLEAAGVSLRDAMQLARHKDPKLTLARYGKSQMAALGVAVEGLPVVGSGATVGQGLTPLERLLCCLLAAAGMDLGCLLGCLPDRQRGGSGGEEGKGPPP